MVRAAARVGPDACREVRDEWKTADPERRKVIEADVEALSEDNPSWSDLTPVGAAALYDWGRLRSYRSGVSATRRAP